MDQAFRLAPNDFVGTTVFAKTRAPMKRLIALPVLGLVFAISASAEVITNSMLIGTVQKAMTAAHYKETGLDMAASQPGQDLRFWAVGDGILILRLSNSSSRVLGMTYSLCDERPKALRRTFDFDVASFDTSNGTMAIHTRKGESGGAANRSQLVRPQTNQTSAGAGSAR